MFHLWIHNLKMNTSKQLEIMVKIGDLTTSERQQITGEGFVFVPWCLPSVMFKWTGSENEQHKDGDRMWGATEGE